MATKDFKRKLSAIFSADVAGYSRLMGEDEAATVSTLETYREVMSTLIKQHRGRVVDSPGDNVLAEFGSVVDAVQCGVAVQNELQARNAELPENRRMKFRIGINLGDVIEEGERIYGDGVNIAARLEALADPGGICISKTAFDHIETKLPLGYEYLGDQTVKNIAKPVGAYRVLMEPRVTVAEEIEKERIVPVWRRKAILVGAVVVLVVAVAVGTWNFYFRTPPTEPASVEKMAFPLPEKPSIAVLPFVNMSGDPDQEYIADGITENIITALSKIPEMFVMARTSTFSYKGKPVKIKQVSEELGVRYVLEGSVQKEGDRVRITAQLIDALKGHHLWAEQYNRDMKGFFVLLDEITKEIGTALQVQLTWGDYARHIASTDNFEAWGYAIKGYDVFRHSTKRNNAKARELFEKAVKLDPEYVVAWRMLGYTYYMDAWMGWSKSRRQSIQRTIELAQKALSIDDSYAGGHALLADAYLLTRQHEKAIAEGEKALALDPNDPLGYIVMAKIMHYSGRFEEAISMIKTGMRLHGPHFPAHYLLWLGYPLHMAGRNEEALPVFEKLLERSRKGEFGQLWVHINLAAINMKLGLEEEARKHADEVLRLSPKFSLEWFSKMELFKDPAHLERRLDPMRKAGLPETPPLPLPDKPSIAVLPFVNMSGDPEQEYFSDGITEQIITSISKIPAIFVIARNSSFAYKNKSMKVQQIAKELGVRYLIEGSIQRDNDKVRINAQLVDALSGKHIWAEDYDRKFEDIFAIQDEIAMEIMAALQIKLTLGAKADLKYDGTRNFEAYKKYLKARYHIIRRTKEDVHLGQQLAKEAIDIDPEYAAAYRFLGWSYLDEVWFGMTKTPAKSIKQAEQMAQKAIFLKGYQAPDYILLSGISLLKKDFDDAIEYGEKSVEFDPNNSNGHFILGMALRYEGQYKEVISKFEKAIRLSPIKQINYLNNLGWTYLLNKGYKSAILIFNKAIQRNPDYLFAYMGLTAAYNLSGDKDKSNWAAKNVLRIKPKFSLAAYEKRSPIKIEEDKKRIISAMRKAGLK